MDVARTLTEGESAPVGPRPAACPRCGEPAAELSGVVTTLSSTRLLRRCARCGTRHLESVGASDPVRLSFDCVDCALPFLAEDLLPHRDHRCPDCQGGRIPADLPDLRLAEATEREVRAALERSWTFVAAPPLGQYLDRLVRQIARRMEAAPAEARVVLFEDARLRTLALPSGTLLVSVGTLLAIEDEAELAFVLAHELAHAAGADAAVRLVRMGFHALSRGSDAANEDGWLRAAFDLLALGYGRHRERDADLRALDAVLALGYDPHAVTRHLHRLRTLIERGDPRVEELALAHPPPGDRLRRMDKALFGRDASGGRGRVNREVFRRAAGHRVLSTQLARTSGMDGTLAADFAAAAPGDDSEVVPGSAGTLRLALWLGLAVLAALLAVVLLRG